MANAGPKGIIRHEENWATDSIAASAADGVGYLVSYDSGDTAFARAVAAGKGLHVAGSMLGDGANKLLELCGDTLMFAGQEGHCAVEVLFQLSTAATVAFNFGFNDDVNDASNTLPAELSGTTWTTNAATFIGFAYDTDADNDELHCMWVDDTVNSDVAIANLRMKGLAPTASKWLFMRVELQDRGSGKGLRATFLAVDHNGRSVEKVFDTSVDRDCPLCLYLGVESRSTTAIAAYVKGLAWEQSVADM